MTTLCESLNCLEIYEILSSQEGAQVTCNFASQQELELFRVRMYQTKKQQEKLLTEIGFLEEADIQSLSFKKSKVDDIFVVSMMLVPKVADAKKYDVFVILPDKHEK